MRLLILVALVMTTNTAVGADDTGIDAESVANFAGLALQCIHQEYPNKIGHVMQSDEDVAPPRDLTPAFYGCFDWHSSVHGHWLLARLARFYPEAGFAAAAKEGLAQSLTAEKLQGDADYLAGKGRASWERPYGLAWLLCLAEELRVWDDPAARQWSANLKPLEEAAANRLKEWLPKLHYAIRTGEHSQTAFAFGLVLDWARAVGDEAMADLVKGKTLEFYIEDAACPLSYEPSGQDFLSPCLAEADLMRRVLPPPQFAKWLDDFLPEIPADGSAAWLPIGVVTDRADGKLAHLDGLNLSRAWMLEGMAAGLPENDPRRASLQAAADVHRKSGLASVTGEHYEGGHWLGSFATYLVTGKGLETNEE
jgi:hypothetical protein